MIKVKKFEQMPSPLKAREHFTHFHFSASKNKNVMTCKHCQKELVYNFNTTGQTTHLKYCRPDLRILNSEKIYELLIN